jgi:hypothetical protein
MTGISFVITTSGTNDEGVEQVIDSIEANNIPEYEILLIGGLKNNIKRKNTIHIPFDESITEKPWTTRKKNQGVFSSCYDVCVVMHDYVLFDSNWYTEFEKFGIDWDICVHRNRAKSFGKTKYADGNGWRLGFNQIPGYPEIPMCTPIPRDIDCFVPYMCLDGGYWVCKKHVMLYEPLDESMYHTDPYDMEWSSRVVPGWLGQKISQVGFRIVTNPNCITICNKERWPFPGDPDFEKIQNDLNWLWDKIRKGYRRPGVYHYDSAFHRTILT